MQHTLALQSSSSSKLLLAAVVHEGLIRDSSIQCKGIKVELDLNSEAIPVIASGHTDSRS